VWLTRAGLSAVGGDGTVQSVLTLGNILRQYNPDIKGLSTGTGGVDSDGAHLNLAVTGAIVQDMEAQANNFISRAKATAGIDFDNDWKVRVSLSVVIVKQIQCNNAEGVRRWCRS
jgi:phospholipase B1